MCFNEDNSILLKANLMPLLIWYIESLFNFTTNLIFVVKQVYARLLTHKPSEAKNVFINDK